MKYNIKKSLSKLFKSKSKEKIEVVVNDIDKLKYTCESLNNEIQILREDNQNFKDKLTELTDIITQINSLISPLVSDYNKKNAQAYISYKSAIDFLYKLNFKFEQSIPYFDRENKLDSLQSLVQHLSDSANKIIKVSSSPLKERIDMLYNDIEEFNKSYKPGLLSYLDSMEKSWNECVQLPATYYYDPGIMKYIGNEPLPGTPIYVVSLGFQFPNSNGEEKLPSVMTRLS